MSLRVTDLTHVFATGIRSRLDVDQLIVGLVSFGPKIGAFEEQFANSTKSLLPGDVFAQLRYSSAQCR